MPASKPAEMFPGFTAEVEPVEPEPDVYFTDQSPTFKLILRNPSETTFVEGSSLRWYLAIGDGMPEPVHTGLIQFELGPGEKVDFEIGDELLAFAGHGVVGVGVRPARGANSSELKVRSGRVSDSYTPLYSFSVWDESVYETQHEYPQRLQRITIGLTGAVVLFAVLNFVITLIEAGIL